MPIGNLTSQYFANHYLAGADHYAKEVLQIKTYIRYMDDSVLWHDDKKTLMNAGLSFKEYSSAELKLTLKPFGLNRNSYGLPFLGYLLYPDRTRLAQRSRKRFIKKLRLYADNLITGVWTQQEYQAHVLPLIAFTEHAEAKEFSKGQQSWVRTGCCAVATGTAMRRTAVPRIATTPIPTTATTTLASAWCSSRSQRAVRSGFTYE